MFYCNDCRKERNWPITFAKSWGRCELCGKESECNDMPSSHLPPLKIDPKKCLHFINHLSVRTRGQRKSENDRSPPPRVEVECAACGWTGWYVREKKAKK